MRNLLLSNEALASSSITGDGYDGLSVISSNLSACRLSRFKAKSVALGGGVTQSVFTDCDFIECDFTFLAVGNVKLVNCRFVECKLRNFFSVYADIVKCSFPSTLIENGSILGKVPLEFSAIIGRSINRVLDNDFTSARLVNFDFKDGVQLRRDQFDSSSIVAFISDTRVASSGLKKLHGESGDPTVAELQKLLAYYAEQGQIEQIITDRKYQRYSEILKGF